MPASQTINVKSGESRSVSEVQRDKHHCGLSLKGALSRKGWPLERAGLNEHREGDG